MTSSPGHGNAGVITGAVPRPPAYVAEYFRLWLITSLLRPARRHLFSKRTDPWGDMSAGQLSVRATTRCGPGAVTFPLNACCDPWDTAERRSARQLWVRTLKRFRKATFQYPNGCCCDALQPGHWQFWAERRLSIVQCQSRTSAQHQQLRRGLSQMFTTELMHIYIYIYRRACGCNGARGCDTVPATLYRCGLPMHGAYRILRICIYIYI